MNLWNRGEDREYKGRNKNRFPLARGLLLITHADLSSRGIVQTVDCAQFGRKVALGLKLSRGKSVFVGGAVLALTVSRSRYTTPAGRGCNPATAELLFTVALNTRLPRSTASSRLFI